MRKGLIVLLACVACDVGQGQTDSEAFSAELQAAAGSGSDAAANARRPRGPRWRTVQRVELFDGGDATEPRVASDPQGRATAVWTQTSAGVGSIWSSRVSGANWSAAVEIDDSDPRGSIGPLLTEADNGNAVALWKRPTQTKAFTVNQFRNNRWGTPQILLDSVSSSAFFGPVLSGSRNGAALMAWAQTAGRGSTLTASTLAGTTWTTTSLPLGA